MIVEVGNGRRTGHGNVDELTTAGRGQDGHVAYTPTRSGFIATRCRRGRVSLSLPLLVLLLPQRALRRLPVVSHQFAEQRRRVHSGNRLDSPYQVIDPVELIVSITTISLQNSIFRKEYSILEMIVKKQLSNNQT